MAPRSPPAHSAAGPDRAGPTSSRRWTQWGLVAALILLGVVIASSIDLAERWQSWASPWEVVEADELPLVLLVVAGGGVWWVRRRARNMVVELEASRQREEELRRSAELEERLGQLQKNEALGIFAGGLAHDLSNLLFAIEAFASRLEPGTARARQSSIIGIHDATKRGRELIAKLKELAEPSPIQTQPLALDQHLLSLRELLTSLLPAQTDLRIETSEDLPPVAAEPGAVTQILLNLVANARDALPDGGTIAISTTRVIRPDFDGVRVRVSDPGVGMTSEAVAHAFDPFFTTKPLGVGSGLGLAMVRVLATQLGGSVDIASQPGVGTHCDVFLSRWEEAACPDTSSRWEEAGDSRKLPR